MGKLSRFLRLSAMHRDVETRLLVQEFRSLLTDDHIDDGSATELRAKLFEISGELSSIGHRDGRR